MVFRNKSAPQPSRPSQLCAAIHDMPDLDEDVSHLPFYPIDPLERDLEEHEDRLKELNLLDDVTNPKFKYASNKRAVRKQVEYGNYQDALSRASSDRLGVKTPLQQQFLKSFKRQAANQWAD